MSRRPMPYAVTDVSSLARSLRAQLQKREAVPGHVELLNMLARAAGHRNFQHFKADAESTMSVRASVPVPVEPTNPARVHQTLVHFGPGAVLLRWPARRSHQILALWVLWAGFPPASELTEMQVNAWLKAQHEFGDHAILRREMVGLRLISRTLDGRVYRRIEQRPPADAIMLIGLLKETRPQAA